MFVAPQLARIALRLSHHEYFSITVFSLTLVASLTGKSAVKGLLSCVIGMALTLIGTSPIDGMPRFIFGNYDLIGGFQLLPILVGVFAVAEFLSSTKSRNVEIEKAQPLKMKGFGVSAVEFKQQFGNFVRSAAIGTGIGILPGIGGATSCVLAYAATKNASKHPELFGTGIVDGIIASETANNATIGGAMVPLLTLGIPGDGVTAILLGAFMIHGLQPGPFMFRSMPTLMYAIFASLIVASTLMLIIGYCGMRVFIKLLNIPKNCLLPVVFVLCAVGAFGLNNRIFDTWCLALFGIMGFIFSLFDIPMTPLVISFVLTPIAETNLRRGLQAEMGSFMPFLTRPVSAFFLAVAVLFIFWNIFSYYRAKHKGD
jgi:putative tricarboxylic transport membrane protein